MTAPLICLLLAVLWTPCALAREPGQANAGLRTSDAADAARAISVRGGGAPSALLPAKGRFLIASRSLNDPNFSETVVLLLVYDANAAMGVVINRPTDVRLGSALPDMKELRGRSDLVFLGGPMARDLMLVLIRSAAQLASSERIFADVYVSGKVGDLRKALSHTGKGNRLRAYAGHAGWGAGQLDREIARGDWYVAAADATMIFDAAPSAMWPKLIDRFSGEWAYNGKVLWRAPKERLEPTTDLAD